MTDQWTHAWPPPEETNGAAPGPGGPPGNDAPAPGGLAGTEAPDPSAPPAWSALQALGAFAAAVVGTLILGAVVVGGVGAILGVEAGDLPPGLVILGVLVQDAVIITSAIVFAGLTRRPHAFDFGLRRVRFWRAVGIAAAGLVIFLILNALYTSIFDPKGEQSVADDLGVNDSKTALIAGGFVVIVLAPLAEEFFFRGFFYRGLRNTFAGLLGRGAGITAGALINGLVFGAIHYTDPKTLSIIPVLAMLGVMFCLVYEFSGSLFTVIALHAIVNAAAYMQVAEDDAGVPVALTLGALMLAACILVPRFLRATPPPVPVRTAPVAASAGPVA